MSEAELAEYRKRLDGRTRTFPRSASDCSRYTVPCVSPPACAQNGCALVPKESPLERRFDQQLIEAGFCNWQGPPAHPLAPPRMRYFRQHAPIADRNFVVDFSFPDLRLVVEIQGNVHRIKEKFYSDAEKKILLLLAGWRTLELTGREVRSGRGIEVMKIIASA